MRNRSIANAVDLGDGKTRKNLVQFDHITDADRALADKFGYKPVRRYAAEARRLPRLIQMCRF